MKPVPLFWDAETESKRLQFRQFAQEHIAPHAQEADRQEHMPHDIIAQVASQGLLGSLVTSEYGGRNDDYLQFGLLNEELGAACSSVRTLLTVHSMTVQAVMQWGTAEQKKKYLPGLAQGRTLGAFALTEPQAGSDARGIATSAVQTEGGWILNGVKRWISFGQCADLLLVMAAVETKQSTPANRQAIALLFPTNTPGFSRQPIKGLLGTRASMLAELHFNDCFVPAENVLSRPGFGLAVCSSALEIGRLSVAWGGVGIAQACLEASAAYAAKRRQFDRALAEHQLIQAKITDMMVAVQTARLLCVQASRARQAGHPHSVLDVLMAKYHAAKMAQQAAQQAVQIHGANGCSDEYPVSRLYRDAKTLEIIEGTSEVLQGLIAKQVRMVLNN
ncbi:acyl-CoA dehydrogenase family protein [bacterium]|nr:acyl-CoA dehydrogenase family protein [bacterium]